MTPYVTRTKSMIVLPLGDKIFSERCTEIRIEDEAGGEFVIVSQEGHIDMGKIAIEPAGWPELRAAIDQMISWAKEDES